MGLYPQASPVLGPDAVDLTTGPQCIGFGVQCGRQIWMAGSLWEDDLHETKLKAIDDTILVTDLSIFCYSYEWELYEYSVS